MHMKDWKPRSEWGKQFLADVKAEARAEGGVESGVEAILDVLDARGLAVEPTTRQRIAACTDLGMLARWLRRAATASSAEDVFAS